MFKGRITEEYKLDCDRAWNNPSGTMFIVGKDVEKDGRLMNVVTVAHKIYDVQDYENKKYNAWLKTEGVEMKVSVPTLQCKQTKNAHLAASNAIAESDDTMTIR